MDSRDCKAKLDNGFSYLPKRKVVTGKCNFTSQGIYPKLIMLGMQLCVPNGETFRKLLEAMEGTTTKNNES